jgi:hypothetical protein
MTDLHLTMEQLLAVRDGDRSEAGLAEAHRHVAACPHCRQEVDRLHQRTARLRALPELAPATDQFPAIRQRLAFERRHLRHRRVAMVGLAAAAALVLTVVGGDLVAPPALDASAQLRSAMDRNTFLEQTLDAWGPDERIIDGRTIDLVLDLEDRIAEVDARLEHAARLRRDDRLPHQLELWQERVSLMTALVDVHLSKTTNLDL